METEEKRSSWKRMMAYKDEGGGHYRQRGRFEHKHRGESLRVRTWKGAVAGGWSWMVRGFECQIKNFGLCSISGTRASFYLMWIL